MAHARRTRYLVDARFQLKYTALLVGVVMAVMGFLGVVLNGAAGASVESARIATEQATKALEESRANSVLTRQNVELATADNPALAKTLTQALDETDKRAKSDLDDLRRQGDELRGRVSRIRLLLIGSGLVLLVVLSFMGIVITQRIVGPVLKLRRLLRRVSTGRLVIGERLRKGDELGDLFETLLQMTNSLRGLERARLATLKATLADAEATGADPLVLEGLHALQVELQPGLGMEALMRKSSAEITP